MLNIRRLFLYLMNKCSLLVDLNVNWSLTRLSGRINSSFYVGKLKVAYNECYIVAPSVLQSFTVTQYIIMVVAPQKALYVTCNIRSRVIFSKTRLSH